MRRTHTQLERELTEKLLREEERERMPCDYKNYAADWKAIRERILSRAGDKCERCALPNYAVYRWDEEGRWQAIGGNLYMDDFQYTGSYAEARELCDHTNEWEEDGAVYRVCVLTISHTNHDTSDNREENLLALCQRCHNRHDAEYRQGNRRKSAMAKKAAGSLF